MTIAQFFRAEWRAWFGKDPVVGGTYELVGDIDPWSDNRVVATVLDVRDGWVRYETIPGYPRSMKLGSFRFCYRPE